MDKSFFIFLALLHVSHAVISDISIGAMLNLVDTSNVVDYEALQYEAAILMALREINNKTDGIHDDILPETQLRTIFSPCPNTFQDGTVKTVDMMDNAFGGLGVRAVLGPSDFSSSDGIFELFSASELSYTYLYIFMHIYMTIRICTHSAGAWRLVGGLQCDRHADADALSILQLLPHKPILWLGRLHAGIILAWTVRMEKDGHHTHLQPSWRTSGKCIRYYCYTRRH
jgi:hypothetical protein